MNGSNQHSAPAQGDRLAPNSIEAEEAVLGSILIDSGAIHGATAVLEPGDFFIVRNQYVYEAILSLHGKGEGIDYLLVTEALRERGQLDEVGGPAYITYLMNHTPSSLYAPAYAEVVHRAALRRQMLTGAGEIAALAHAEDGDVYEQLDRAHTVIADIGRGSQRGGPRRAFQVASDAIDRVEDARLNKHTGILSGFLDLDRITGGFQPENFILVAGRPGMGKTAWLITLLLYMAHAGFRVGISSLEMSEEELWQRIMAQETGIPTNRQRSGDLNDAEWAAYLEANGRLSELLIWIDDTPEVSALQLAAKWERVAAEHGLDLVVIDYLQLMLGSGNDENRNIEVGRISRALKILARKLHIPVLAAAQLSREVEKRADKRPVLSDLRDSGTLEQDADMVLFLYRDDYYNPDSLDVNQCEVIIAKHRHGPTGTIRLYFERDITKFGNLVRNNLEDF